MVDIKNKKDCCGCASCANICPKNCITMKNDIEGFLYPYVNKSKCIQCNLCEKSCPITNVKKVINEPKVYGCYNKDENVRMRSSSGGFFHILCEFIISQKGVVFGAAFDENFDVIHDYAETIEECEKFEGSKYSQSTTGDSYKKAQNFLDEGRKVLFSGTPCQIAGLYTYLKRDYDNLFTQDIVCHSVPTPKVWDEYKGTVSNNKRIRNITFRGKENGWSQGTFKMVLDDGNIISLPYAETEYMKGFLNGLYSRPSCYECKFSSISRQSDITLGDFWGVESFYPELYDNKGVSLVIINSKKGKSLFDFAKNMLIYKKVKMDKALFYNPAINNCARENPNRDVFFISKDCLFDKVNRYFYKFDIATKNKKQNFLEKIKSKVFTLKERNF